MIARLILLMLLVVGAAPVGASPARCHGMAAMVAAPSHRPPPAPVSSDHGCIGCAAIDDWLAERVAAPRAVAAPRPFALPTSLHRLAPFPPTSPPPRIG